MIKRPIAPLLQREYSKLEKREKKLRKQLERVHKAHRSSIAVLLRSTLSAATDDGRIKHTELMKRVDTVTASRLAHDTQAMKQKYGDSETFPFSVFRFDQLNKLDALRADFVLSELKLAEEEELLIMAHLKAYAEETWMELEEWLDYYGAMMTAAAITAVITDTEYPVEKVLRRNHIQTAEQAVKRMEQASIRGARPEEVEAEVCDYVSRREKTRSDAVIFYEGTRVTTEAVKAVTKDIAVYFSSHTEDEMACKYCKKIEEEQLINPIPMDDMKAGKTAPPFHDYCRCYIEVIYHDDD